MRKYDIIEEMEIVNDTYSYAPGRTEEEKWRIESESRKAKAESLFKGKLRKASIEDYKPWLKGYLELGKFPTHYYNRPFDQWNEFFVAEKDFEISPLYGAQLIRILIPEGINFLGGDPGHSDLYFMKGFYIKSHFVPIFQDINFEEEHLTKLLTDFIRLEIRKGIEFRRSVSKGYSSLIPSLAQKIIDYYDPRKMGDISGRQWFEITEQLEKIYYCKYNSRKESKKFIKHFSKMDEGIKKAIIKVMFESDFDNGRIINWLDKHESQLVREVGRDWAFNSEI